MGPSQDLASILSDLSITFTNKILYFRPTGGTEVLGHHYFCPEVLVFSYDPPDIEFRFLKAILESKYGSNSDSIGKKYFQNEEIKDTIESLVLEYADKHGF